MTFFAEDRDINILGYLSIRINELGGANADGNVIRLAHVNVGGGTKIRGSSALDPVLILRSAFARGVAVDLAGNDDFLFAFSSFFGHKATFKGSAGTDTLSSNANLFALPLVADFEVVV